MIESNLVDLTATSTKELLQNVTADDSKSSGVEVIIVEDGVTTKTTAAAAAVATESPIVHSGLVAVVDNKSISSTTTTNPPKSIATNRYVNYNPNHRNTTSKFRKPVHSFYPQPIASGSGYLSSFIPQPPPPFGFASSVNSSQYFIAPSALGLSAQFGSAASTTTTTVAAAAATNTAAGSGAASNYFYSTNTYDSKQSFLNHRNYLQNKKKSSKN